MMLSMLHHRSAGGRWIGVLPNEKLFVFMYDRGICGGFCSGAGE